MAILFYLSDRKTGTIGSVFIKLEAGEEKTISISELGDAAKMHFLMVSNPDLINKGEFIVEFLAGR